MELFWDNSSIAWVLKRIFLFYFTHSFDFYILVCFYLGLSYVLSLTVCWLAVHFFSVPHFIDGVFTYPMPVILLFI